MCEILVKAIDSIHSDPDMDLIESAKRGDPIIVKPDGWPWGIEEKKPPAQGGKFVILKLSGVEPSLIEEYITHHQTMDKKQEIIIFRKYKFHLDTLPAGIISELNQKGFFETTWTLMKQYMIDKLTDKAI